MGKDKKINPEDLSDEGHILYCVILLLDALAKAPDRNTEEFTRRITNTRNMLIGELTQ